MIKVGDLVVSVLEPDLLMGVERILRTSDETSKFEWYAVCIYFDGTHYQTVSIPTDFLVHRDESIGPENVLNNTEHTLYAEDGDKVVIRTVKHVS